MPDHGAQPRNVALLVMAYGGPHSLDEVRPFLQDIRRGRPVPEEAVARLQDRYARIGGRSPLPAITATQAEALADRLNTRETEHRFRSYVGMQHWHPYIREAARQIAADGPDRVVALPMTPYASALTTGPCFREVCTSLDSFGWTGEVFQVQGWYGHPEFIRSWADRIREELKRMDEPSSATVLFTAHSLPVDRLPVGDPYVAQVEESAQRIASEAGLRPGDWQVAYQCGGHGGGRWLGPAVEDLVVDLTDRGAGRVVAPIGYVADNLETQYDLDVDLREAVVGRGGRMSRVRCPNGAPGLLEALVAAVDESMAVGAELDWSMDAPRVELPAAPDAST